MEERLTRFTIDFDTGLYERIKAYAESLENRPMSYVVRKAVQKYLDEQEQQQPPPAAAKAKAGK